MANKILPVANKILSAVNVNSGYTSFYNDLREIVIYRKEEWFKVLIHELMHYYDYDIKTTINFMSEQLFIKGCFKRDVTNLLKKSDD